MHLSCKIPLITINSCEAAAYKHKEKSKIFVALDAAMDEFFCAEFEVKNGELHQLGEIKLLKRDRLPTTVTCGAESITAESVGLLALEKFKSGKIPKDFDPIYLRQPRITERKK